MGMTREHAALSASAPPSAFHTPESARPLAAPSTPTDSARSIRLRRAWSTGVQDFSVYERKKFRNPRLVRPSPPEYFDPERIDLWHNGCAHAESIWEQYPEVKDDDRLRKELLYSSRTQLLVCSATSAPDGAAPISAAAASTPMSSPPPKCRSPTRSPRVADARRQLEFVAAQRVQAAARGRAARVAARALRARSIARRFRPTPTRSGAATHVARTVRSYLARRHLGRGGDGRAAAAAAAAAADASSTSPAPLSAKPAARRSGRSGRTLTFVDDDHGDYGSSDDDNDSRSCLTPHSHLDLEYYSDMALAAAANEPEDDKPDDDDYKRHMPEVVDGSDESGLPKPLTSSPPSSRRSTDRSGDSHHGGAHHNDITHVGTSWSQTGDVWWTSASGDHHEIAYDYNEDEYDDDENDDHHDEEEPTGDY